MSGRGLDDAMESARMRGETPDSERHDPSKKSSSKKTTIRCC